MNEIKEGNSLISPRLIALNQELEAGNGNALDVFWNEITQQGTPLIEPIQDDEENVFITFLWRSVEEVENVVVYSMMVGYYNLNDMQMSRLLNTNLWYKTCRVRNDIRTTYELSPNDSLIPFQEAKDWKERTATFRHDPLNPNVVPKDEENLENAERIKSIIEAPAALPQSWVTPQAHVPAGRLEDHRLRSNILDNERRVWVYTPPGYTSSGAPYGLLILFDGMDYISVIPTPTILDNLLVENLIPPLVTVLIDIIDGETRRRELPCYSPFPDFLARELIPWAREHYHITSDPTQTIVGGSSYGGLAATFAGLRHPEIFGKVLSQSGSFFWKPDDEGEHEWLASQFVASPKVSLSFYLDVGLFETIPLPNDGPSQLVANRHMRNILQAKGYPLYYAEYSGAHDPICWKGTLAHGLLALIGKDKVKN